MKIERSSLDQVKERFNMNKKKMEVKQKEYDLDSRVKEANVADEQYKELKKEKKKEKKRKHGEAFDGDDGPSDDMAALMGFSGFGGSRKNI